MSAVNKILWLMLTCHLLLLLTSCDSEPTANKSEIINKPTQPALTFLVHPYDNPSKLIERFTPLCNYLSTQLGRPLKLIIARSYVDQIQRISSGQADLAYIGPSPFLRAQDHYLKDKKNKLTPLAAEIRSGNKSYRSVLVVRSDSSIYAVKELTDHTLAFGAPHSFGSHYVPRVLLGNAGLSFSDLRDYAYLGRHERVALAVLHGDFDAGGLRQDVALQYHDRDPGLRILAISPPLPPHIIVARPGLNKRYSQLIKQALIVTGKPDKEYQQALLALGPEIGFSEINMADFERARKVITAVESQPIQLSPW